MEVKLLDARILAIVVLAITFGAGCDGRMLAAGNLMLAVVPCVLLWLTVNLRKAN